VFFDELKDDGDSGVAAVTEKEECNVLNTPFRLVDEAGGTELFERSDRFPRPYL
jgi:hypothetical protein